MALWPFAPDAEFRTAPGGFLPETNDFSEQIEKTVSLPWAIEPEYSWLDYRCHVEVSLDPGMALHKPLPQSSLTVDSLSSVQFDDPLGDANTGSVNIQSNSDATDIIQRMATSTYRFVLRGNATRAGFTIPVPGIISIAGVSVTPDMQWSSGQVIVGNFQGIPIYYCEWELHYIIAAPLVSSGAVAPVPFNPALGIRPDAILPAGIDLPVPVPDPADVVGLLPIPPGENDPVVPAGGPGGGGVIG